MQVPQPLATVSRLRKSVLKCAVSTATQNEAELHYELGQHQEWPKSKGPVIMLFSKVVSLKCLEK